MIAGGCAVYRIVTAVQPASAGRGVETIRGPRRKMKSGLDFGTVAEYSPARLFIVNNIKLDLQQHQCTTEKETAK
jgi:hypothetical protein